MAHHLLVFPTADVAERVARDLCDEGFQAVSTARGDDGTCEVSIDDHRLPVQEGAGAVEGLQARFQQLADDLGGQYVESAPGQAGD